MGHSTKRLTTEQFITNARKIHGDEYDYSRVVYLNNRTSVEIICKIHGIFKQKPSNHITDENGCPKCYGNKIQTTETWIEEAKQIHGDLYDYSLVEYKAAFTKIKIVCKTHGVFEQKPNHHIASKAGCPYCGGFLNQKVFIMRANEVHNNKFDYSKTKYEACLSKVEVICPTHGSFFTKPKLHLQGRGCYKCAVDKTRTTLEEFLSRAKKVHNDKYDYSKVNLLEKKITIICKHHGEFLQAANGHLSGRGCPICKVYVSKSETNWLDYLNIDPIYRQKILMVNDKKYSVDAYDPNTNTIYEFYGDYWHGNLRVFDPTLINTRANPHKTMQELNTSTFNRELLLKQAGYKLITIWENDWKRQNKLKAFQ